MPLLSLVALPLVALRLVLLVLLVLLVPPRGGRRCCGPTAPHSVAVPPSLVAPGGPASVVLPLVAYPRG